MPRYLVPPEKPLSSTPPNQPPTAQEPPTGRLGLADLTWSARVALDRDKLLVAFVGLLAAAVVFFVFVSLGRLLGGGMGGTALRYLGAAGGYLVLAFTCLVLARMVSFQARTGGVRLGVWDAVEAALVRWRALCLTPGGLVLAAVAAALLLAFLAWIGRFLPTVYTFFFLVEFALGAVVVVAGLVLTWGLFLYPAILAVEETDELDTIRRYFSLYHSHGLTLMGYQLTAMVGAWLAVMVPGLLSVLTLASTARISLHLMGEVLSRSAARVPVALQEIIGTWLTVVTLGARRGMGEVFGAASAARGSMYAFSGVFLGFSLLIIAVATLTYGLAFFVAAGTRTYLAFAPSSPQASAEQRAAA